MLTAHTIRINDYVQKKRLNGIFVIVDLNINAPSSAGVLLITWCQQPHLLTVALCERETKAVYI